MRGKSLTAMLLAIVLVLSAAMIGIGSSQTTAVYVDPAEVTADPSQQFTVDIKVADVDGLTAWEFRLKYDTNVLAFPPVVEEGPFLSSAGTYETDFYVSESYMYGYVEVGCTLLEDSGAAASGSGTLATITITVLGGYPGTTNLTLFDTTLLDVEGNPIDHDAMGGYFYIEKPVAMFTWTPEAPIADETVTFNATASFSPIGLDITAYEWDFGDGTTGEGMIVDHVYTKYRYDPYLINLTVTDSAGETGSIVNPLRIWRDVVASDIWLDTTWALDSAVSEIYYGENKEDGLLIVLTATNLGTVTESFNVTLDCTGGDITPFWTNPITLGAGAGSGFSIMAGWWPVDAEGDYLTTGVYTFTMEVSQVPGEIETDNNVLSATLNILPSPYVLSLTPDTGFASTTIKGAGFNANSTVTITWDGTSIPTVPSPLTTDSNGSFTAIITVPTQNEPGPHNVTATDEDGNTALATFTVLDMTGPQGPPGEKGETGDTGAKGDTGEPGPKGDTGAKGETGDTGAKGDTGEKGDKGDPGEPAPTGLVWASLIIAIIAILIAAYSLIRKKP